MHKKLLPNTLKAKGHKLIIINDKIFEEKFLQFITFVHNVGKILQCGIKTSYSIFSVEGYKKHLLDFKVIGNCLWFNGNSGNL